MAIQFTSADHPLHTGTSRKIQAWLKSLIREEKKGLGEITIVWCTDDYLLEVNKKYLNHDYYTDVITFDYTEGKILSGELLISVERVQENAKQILGDEKMFHVELLRVIGHGVLHLCGYKDGTKSEESIMRAKENYYLAKYEI